MKIIVIMLNDYPYGVYSTVRRSNNAVEAKRKTLGDPNSAHFTAYEFTINKTLSKKTVNDPVVGWVVY